MSVEAREAPAPAVSSPGGDQPIAPASESALTGETSLLASQAAWRSALGMDAAAERDERLALKRELYGVQDHLADLEARLARLGPLLQAVSWLRTAIRSIVWVFQLVVKLAGLVWQWRGTARRIEDARFRSERLVFDPGRREWIRRVDIRAFAGHLRRSFGLFRPTLYRVRPRQRLALARRPRVLHAIANVWVGGSTQLIVDLHDYLGHRIEMEVVTSALPAHGSHQGMTIAVAPQPVSRHLVRGIFSRFRPHIAHVHYWGDVDEAWYKVIFEVAAEFGCPILQNVNTPIAPFANAPIAGNVFVSRSVLDRFGSSVPATVIHPGVDLDRFGPPSAVHADAFDTIGMVYRLESDKLDPDAIELFIKIVKTRPKTRAIVIGDGSLFAHFRSRVEQEALLSHFEFTGFVPYEDLPAWFARFKTFIAPVRQESFGQVIPFAMCAGLAVAGYRIGAVPEILGSNETLADGLDEAAKIVVALLDDHDRIAALGERNRAIALERFSVEQMAIGYFHLYRELAPREVDILLDLPDAIKFPL